MSVIADKDREADGRADPGAGAAMPPLRLWSAVLLMMVVGVFNIVDRFLPSVLIEAIKADLHLSDTGIGLINGFGFLIVYALVGIPIARIADRGRYGLVVGGCLTLWSLMTMLGGFAQSGLQLALTRMGVALGEAGSSPAAHAFISHHFPVHRRSTPLALLSVSVPVAGILAFLVGGLLGQAVGWRATFMILGGAGLLLSPVAFLMLRERPAIAGAPLQARAAAGPFSLRPFLQPGFLLILAASSCIGIGAYALTTFGPAYLMRVHGFTLAQIGVQYGLTVGGAGLLSLAIVGPLADRLSVRDPRWLLWIVSLMILVILPFLLTGLLASSPTVALVCTAVATCISTAYLAPVIAAVHRLVPAGSRATASALFLFSTAVLGGLGPLLTGMISDALTPSQGVHALATALLLVPAMHFCAALLYAGASARFADAVSN